MQRSEVVSVLSSASEPAEHSCQNQFLTCSNTLRWTQVSRWNPFRSIQSVSHRLLPYQVEWSVLFFPRDQIYQGSLYFPDWKKLKRLNPPSFSVEELQTALYSVIIRHFPVATEFPACIR